MDRSNTNSPIQGVERARLEEHVEKFATGIGDSAVCITLFTDNYKKGIDSLLQFSLMIMMDKPIFLLVPQHVKIPERVLRVVDGIERWVEGDKASFEGATERLLLKAREKGFSA